MAVKEEKKQVKSAWEPHLNIVEYLNIGREQLKSKSGGRSRSKYSDKQLTAEKAYTCALLYQRSKSKERYSTVGWTSSSGKKLQKDTYLENDTSSQQLESTILLDNISKGKGLRQTRTNGKFTACTTIVSDLTYGNGLFVIESGMFAVSEGKIDNVIVHVDRYDDMEMMNLINNLRIETSLCMLPDQMVTATHLDNICGLGKVETTNPWTISLLPNRQLRLEHKGQCYRIRLAKTPTFHKKSVTVEGCLVPGGHLFRLTFTLNINDELKDEWLAITDNRYICNESVLDYMIAHPFGSLESIRSTLSVAFVSDPSKPDIDKEITEAFDCYYYERHFIYKAINRHFVDRLKIGRWGAREDLHALFFTTETSVQHPTESGCLMAIIADKAWYRAWKATIYADINNPESILTIGKKDLYVITPAKTDFLGISSFDDDTDVYITSECVFDLTSRQFSSVNLLEKKDCVLTHRIIAKPMTDKRNYDFRITGCSATTREDIDLKVRVLIPENRAEWESVVQIPFARIYAFLDMVLSELSEKNKLICDIDTEVVTSFSFERLAEYIAILPKVETLGSALSCLRSHQLENLALLTFDALYRPLLSLDEAEKIASFYGVGLKHQGFRLEDVCGIDRTRLMHRVHRHISYRNTKDTNLLKKSEILKSAAHLDVWRKVVPRFLRLDDFQQVEHDNLIENVAEYFDNLLR